MVTTDTLIMIIAPHIIIQELQGIPLVCSDAPTLIMTNSTVFPIYIIYNDIECNKSGVEIFNNTTLGISRTQAMQKNVQENLRSSKTTRNA